MNRNEWRQQTRKEGIPLESFGSYLRFLCLLLFKFFLICLLAEPSVFAQTPKILVNHVGYEKDGPKRAVVLGHEADTISEFKIIDELTGKAVFTGVATKVGAVQRWKDWRFWTVDFSAVTAEGNYLLECATGAGAVRSFPFPVRRQLLE